MIDENFKISLQILQVLTPIFHSNSVSALYNGWLQCMASVMQGLLTLQNHCCKISHDILPESKKLKSDQFNSTLLKYFTKIDSVEIFWVIGPNLKILSPAVQCVWISNSSYLCMWVRFPRCLAYIKVSAQVNSGAVYGVSFFKNFGQNQTDYFEMFFQPHRPGTPLNSPWKLALSVLSWSMTLPI